jgi:hypothetical protein
MVVDLVHCRGQCSLKRLQKLFTASALLLTSGEKLFELSLFKL